MRTNELPPQHFSSLTAARELHGFALAEGDDVRGWAVVAQDGLPAGTIDRLMVDNRTRQVRYLAVALDASLERRRGSVDARTVLVPVGVAERVKDSRTVVLRHITTDMLRRAPRLPARPVTRFEEDATLAAYGLPTSAETGGEFYAGAFFDNSRLFNT
jgi:hypothetical protein